MPSKEVDTLFTCLKMPSRARAFFRRRLLVSTAAALLVCTGVASVDAAVIAIARGGDTAPNASGGATFTVFDEPMVNSRGDVVFEATLSNGDESIYLMPNGGPLTKIAEEGDTVDGATLSFDFDGPAINDAGTVFFVNRGSTGAFTAAAYMMPAGGTLASIMKQGDSAPGTSGGVFVSFDDISVNPKKGDFAVIGSYTGGSTFKVGIWLRKVLNKKGKFQVVSVVLSGDTLPGTGGGVIGTTTSPTDLGDLDGPWLGDNDTVAFAVDNISGSTGPDETGSIWAIKPRGKIRSFILMTDTPPAALGGTIDSIGIGRPGIVDDKIAALLEVSSGSVAKGIVTKTLGTFTNKAKVLIKPGDSAPGTTGTFTEGLSSPTINSKGGVEFAAEIAGDAANFAGEFVTNAKKNTRNVVLAGDTKPGGGSWVNLEEGSVSNKFITFLDDNDDNLDPTVVGVFRASK